MVQWLEKVSVHSSLCSFVSVTVSLHGTGFIPKCKKGWKSVVKFVKLCFFSPSSAGGAAVQYR